MINETDLVSAILRLLPRIHEFHSPYSSIYTVLDDPTKDFLRGSSLLDPVSGYVDLGEIGRFEFPYICMGAIDSVDLFGLNELILFAYYWTNRKRYRRSADVGANLGLHSLVMNRCGWKVTAYEPDPNHVAIIHRNLKLNNVHSVELSEVAVSCSTGVREFVRVMGNRTGSHLAGAKDDPYGDLERFEVSVIDPHNIFETNDFIKFDVEGEEAAIILNTCRQNWDGTEVIAEVGSRANAELIFDHLSNIGVNCFSQKIGWQRCSTLEDMPSSYRDGSVFLSLADSMNWQGPEIRAPFS